MNKTPIITPPDKKATWIDAIKEVDPESRLLKRINEQLAKLTEDQKTKRLIEVNNKLDELEENNANT